MFLFMSPTVLPNFTRTYRGLPVFTDAIAFDVALSTPENPGREAVSPGIANGCFLFVSATPPPLLSELFLVDLPGPSNTSFATGPSAGTAEVCFPAAWALATPLTSTESPLFSVIPA